MEFKLKRRQKVVASRNRLLTVLVGVSLLAGRRVAHVGRSVGRRRSARGRVKCDVTGWAGARDTDR